MRVFLTLEVPDDNADPEDKTGLTSPAYDELTEAIADLGYSLVSGPTKAGA